MSLFACEECGVVENTALCGWVEGPSGRRLICSQCNPTIGRWHGRWPREDAVRAGYTPIEGSRYIERKATA